MRATSAIAVLFGGLVAVAQTPNADDKPPPIVAKDLATSVNNLKQIGLAFYDFIEQNKVMPIDIVDKKANPLLSWRVAILPQLGHEKLFKQFKFDEPWDSENNKKLIAKIPKVYAPVRVKAEPGTTFYQTFTGKDALFQPGNLLVTLPDSIPDGTVNTGLVFEAGEPVVWTKPADLPFDAKNPLPRLGGVFDGQCHVLMCDGTILRLKKDRDEKTMKHLIMPNDGQVIDLDTLLK